MEKKNTNLCLVQDGSDFGGSEDAGSEVEMVQTWIRRGTDAPVRRLAMDGFRRGGGRPKKYCLEVIRHDMEQLQLTEDIALDRKLQRTRIRVEEVNPMKQVPAMMHEGFKLFESHAILRYLTYAFPRVADHWYPTALYRRAEVDSVLDWHHSNLRSGAVGFFRNAVLAPAVGLPLNPQAVAEDEKVLLASLEKIESFWLQKNGRFLLGNDQPSIADLSLVCEIMQLEVLDKKDRDRILGPYKSVLKWIDNTKDATEPHFHEVHKILFKFKEKLLKQRSVRGNGTTESSRKSDIQAKI